MTGIRGVIRVVPDPANPSLGLSKDKALDEASKAFTRAKGAQADLVSNLNLTHRLIAPPSNINHAILRGMKKQADAQVEKAQAVVAALMDSMEALERYNGRGGRP